MKNHSQLDRLKFALAGLRQAWQQETSLRTEAGVFVVALAYVIWKHPPIFWWVAIFAAAGALNWMVFKNGPTLRVLGILACLYIFIGFTGINRQAGLYFGGSPGTYQRHVYIFYGDDASRTSY